MSSFCCAIAIVFYGGLAIDVSAAFQKQNVCRLSSGILLQLTWHEAISLCAPAATTAAVATQNLCPIYNIDSCKLSYH